MEWTYTYEKFCEEARAFQNFSSKLNDSWELFDDKQKEYGLYLKKQSFVKLEGRDITYKAEHIVSYSPSYGVPLLSFNVWDSTGTLLTLKQIFEISQIRIDEAKFYSTITQQEHPLLFRPYFTVHPCHSSSMMEAFKDSNMNLLISFLSTMAPLVRLDLSLEYANTNQ